MPYKGEIGVNGNKKDFTILCPRCDYRPTHIERWICEPGCGAYWNTFWTRGLCPGCGKLWNITQCPSAATFRRTGIGIARLSRTRPRRKRVRRSNPASDTGSASTAHFARLPTVGAPVSTIVVVRKLNLACIACDTLASVGSVKQKAHYCAVPDKIFGFRDTWIGTVGYAVHNAVLKSYSHATRTTSSSATPKKYSRPGARCIACCARSIT